MKSNSNRCAFAVTLITLIFILAPSKSAYSFFGTKSASEDKSAPSEKRPSFYERLRRKLTPEERKSQQEAIYEETKKQRKKATEAKAAKAAAIVAAKEAKEAKAAAGAAAIAAANAAKAAAAAKGATLAERQAQWRKDYMTEVSSPSPRKKKNKKEFDGVSFK